MAFAIRGLPTWLSRRHKGWLMAGHESFVLNNWKIIGQPPIVISMEVSIMSSESHTGSDAEPSAELAENRPLYVAGIGASAGGLEALERLFRKVPVDTGMAFVVVQHLSPDFVSMMDELLVRQTVLPVHTVSDGMEIEPNAIYLIPPRKEMIISGGRLLLTDKDPAQGLTLPIDLFFRSLAQELGSQAIGVILSGTGSDGSRGIRAIHEAGGLAIVQQEDTALFDGMPKSALATGAIDLVLPPEEIAAALGRFSRYGRSQLHSPTAGPLVEDAMQKLLRLLRELHGIDFALYKQSTVLRRIERRLLMSQSGDLDEYVRQATSNPHELSSLYRDLLIGVTQFFRDREAFDLLENDVLPELLAKIPPNEEFRAWVAGCATGEEAYSLAILIHEQMTRLGRPIRAKVFATDVHQMSLDVAGTALYNGENLADVSPERLERYFVRQGDRYQVCSELRQMIVFAPHNLLKDAPFTRLDLVTCRNLLIYLQAAAQRKVISLFHFGLKAGGVLLLGPSENVGELEEEFTPIDRHWKLYRKRRDVRLSAEVRLPPTMGLPLRRGGRSAAPPPDVELLRVYDELLDQFIPAGILVNRQHQVVHVFGDAGQYLRFKPGRPSTDVLDMFEPELKTAVAGALQRAEKDMTRVSLTGLTINGANDRRLVTLTVLPLIRQVAEPHLLVTLDETRPAAQAEARSEPYDVGEVSRERISDLEHELRTSRENLQATIEELETSNEELQATNEELIASNEELQSTNEELHSVNEELYTVNGEYQRKIAELTEMTDDLENLLQATSIGVLFLDKQLGIRKFTQAISGLFNIVKQDVGRPFQNFTHNIEFPDLLERVQEVLESGRPVEREVVDRFGGWHLMRILRYRSSAGAEGVLLTLVDIQSLKEAASRLRAKQRELQGILDNSPALIFAKDLEGRYVMLNRQAKRVFRVSPEQAQGKTIRQLLPADTALQVEQQDMQVLKTGKSVQAELTLKVRGRLRTYLSIKYPLQDDAGKVVGISGFWTDITAQKRVQEISHEAVAQRDRFLAMLSHELRNPLAAVQNAAHLLAQLGGASPTGTSNPMGTIDLSEEIDVILRQSKHMGRLLDDLLDIARVSQGKLVLRRERLDLCRTAADALANVRSLAADRGVRLHSQIGETPLVVEGDPDRLQQVQVNLLVNAIKYTPAGGEVQFSLQHIGDQAEIRVRDSGLGMSKKLLRKVFELFVQGDNTLDRADGGMGVGLTLVRSIVDLHGGSVTADSAGPGQGSTFVVRLPLAAGASDHPPEKVHAASISRENSARDGGRSCLGLDLLLVEDNDDARTVLARLLETYGYRVRAAADGDTALMLIGQRLPDVALVDVGLPRISGYELAARIRTNWPGIRPQLIAVTGYGRPEDRDRALAAGFNRHLTKPVHIDQLREILDEVAAQMPSRNPPAGG
jgi:two-component system CheB/CheR fusion protein